MSLLMGLPGGFNSIPRRGHNRGPYRGYNRGPYRGQQDGHCDKTKNSTPVNSPKTAPSPQSLNGRTLGYLVKLSEMFHKLGLSNASHCVVRSQRQIAQYGLISTESQNYQSLLIDEKKLNSELADIAEQKETESLKQRKMQIKKELERIHSSKKVYEQHTPLVEKNIKEANESVDHLTKEYFLLQEKKPTTETAKLEMEVYLWLVQQYKYGGSHPLSDINARIKTLKDKNITEWRSSITTTENNLLVHQRKLDNYLSIPYNLKSLAEFNTHLKPLTALRDSAYKKINEVDQKRKTLDLKISSYNTNNLDSKTVQEHEVTIKDLIKDYQTLCSQAAELCKTYKQQFDIVEPNITNLCSEKATSFHDNELSSIFRVLRTKYSNNKEAIERLDKEIQEAKQDCISVKDMSSLDQFMGFFQQEKIDSRLIDPRTISKQYAQKKRTSTQHKKNPVPPISKQSSTDFSNPVNQIKDEKQPTKSWFSNVLTTGSTLLTTGSNLLSSTRTAILTKLSTLSQQPDPEETHPASTSRASSTTSSRSSVTSRDSRHSRQTFNPKTPFTLSDSPSPRSPYSPPNSPPISLAELSPASSINGDIQKGGSKRSWWISNLISYFSPAPASELNTHTPSRQPTPPKYSPTAPIKTNPKSVKPSSANSSSIESSQDGWLKSGSISGIISNFFGSQENDSASTFSDVASIQLKYSHPPQGPKEDSPSNPPQGPIVMSMAPNKACPKKSWKRFNVSPPNQPKAQKEDTNNKKQAEKVVRQAEKEVRQAARQKQRKVEKTKKALEAAALAIKEEERQRSRNNVRTGGTLSDVTIRTPHGRKPFYKIP